MARNGLIVLLFHRKNSDFRADLAAPEPDGQDGLTSRPEPSTPVFQPCANCDHARDDHHHYPGANFNPGHWGECESDGCPCRLFVRDCTPDEADEPARAA